MRLMLADRSVAFSVKSLPPSSSKEGSLASAVALGPRYTATYQSLCSVTSQCVSERRRSGHSASASYSLAVGMAPRRA